MIKQLILVGIGGGAGSIFRYLASILLYKSTDTTFPLGTFIVNISGCLLIGVVAGLCVRNDFFNESLKLLLITGFCGGYTTFSAFSIENIKLMESGNYFISILYIFTSIILGLAAVWLGNYLSKL